MAGNQRLNVLICLFLVVITLAVYWHVTEFRFVNYDDLDCIKTNGDIVRGIDARSIAWAFTNRRDANWMPLTWLSFMLDHEMGGGPANPAPYHRTNLLLHVLNALLLYVLLAMATGKQWRSALVAALFAIHPLHVESVAWVIERKDCLSGFFFMLTLLAYVWYARRPGVGRYVVVAAAFACGLMSKSMLVTVPILLLLLDFWPLERTGAKPPLLSFKRLLLEKVPMLVMSAAVGVVTLIQQSYVGAVSAVSTYPIEVRVANAAASYLLYICKMLWPVRLCCLYPHPRETLSGWLVLAGWIVLIGGSWTAVLLRRRAPYLTVGWLWYVVSLLPVIGIIQVGNQAMADRYTYIPLIGLFLVIVWGVSDLLGPASRWKNAGLAAVSLAALAALGIVAHAQTRYWRNSLSLFGHAVEVTKANPFAEQGLATALSDAGDFRGAVKHFRIALQGRPDYSESHYGLAESLCRLSRPHEAVPEYRATLRLAPDDWQAANNLAWILATDKDPGLRDPDAAVELAESACVRTSYRLAGVLDTLAVAYSHAGRFDDAIATANKAAEASERIGDSAFAKQVRSRIPLYQARKAYSP